MPPPINPETGLEFERFERLLWWHDGRRGDQFPGDSRGLGLALLVALLRAQVERDQQRE